MGNFCSLPKFGRLLNVVKVLNIPRFAKALPKVLRLILNLHRVSVHNPESEKNDKKRSEPEYLRGLCGIRF